MKKLIVFSLTLLLPYFVAAQVVTTTPTFITGDYGGAVTIIFDAAQGNQGLINHTGDVYAHTGVITNLSTSDSDWKHAPTWGDNAAKYKLTSLGNNKWQLNITPSIASYYNLAQGEVVKKLAFVFRSAASPWKEGKATGNSDIFVNIYEAGLNVGFVSPDGNQLVNSGTTVNFTANASETANLELKINGNSVKTQSGTSLTYSQAFSAAGDYKCVISATNSTTTVKDSLIICVAQPAVSATRPAGVNDGINYTSPTSAVLVMYAKDKDGVIADNVFLLGDFNDWSFSNQYQMKKDGNSGYFWLDLTGLTPNVEYGFQYAVKIGNNIVRISDAFSEKVLDQYDDKWLGSDIYPNLKPYPEGKTTGYVSVLETNKQPYNWSSETQNFSSNAPDKNNLVIYELWVHDFTAKRTIKEATERLPYLKSLGINAIELMPIAEFDGNISWGYNPNHFFAPDKAYGTPNDYKKFIDECHKLGIAVILDMVFNHASGNNPWAKLYWNTTTNNVVSSKNPWFNTVAPHSDNVHQDYNHNFQLVRDHFKRVLQYWLTEYKVDGYRMDLSKGYCGNNCNSSGNGDDRTSIIFDYYNAVKLVRPNGYFILEHWEPSEEQNFVNNGMLCWGNMNNTYSQTAMGHLTSDDFSGANKKGWVYYCESHDEQRNFFKAKQWGNGNVQTDETVRINRVPLNVGFNVMLQGPKMMWQFQEMGYDFTICYQQGNTASHTASPGDAQCYRTDTKPLPENLGWFQNNLRMGAYKKVAQMLELRKRFSDVNNNMFLNGTCNLTGGSGAPARYVRWSHNTDKMVVVGNFGVSGTVSPAPFDATGTWYEYFSQTSVNVTSTSHSVTLAPGEIKIYTNTYQSLPNIPGTFPYTEVEDVYDNFKCVVFPTVTNSDIFIESTDNIRKIDVYSLRSEKIMSFGNRTSINVSSLPSGMYLMVVTFDKRQEAFKFIRE